jgi:hypothetical protein
LLAREPSLETREAMQKGVEGKEHTSRLLAGLAISSPDFQRR